MNKELMFSSKSNEWETPWALYNALNEEFHFVVDAAATAENHKAPVFYTKETDGLQQSWQVGPVWCNPPYGREIGKWVKKAYESNQEHKTVVVMLIPSRTDTRWFHDYIYHNPKAEIRFIKGRLKFGNSKTNAPFPSMIVVFR